MRAIPGDAKGRPRPATRDIVPTESEEQQALFRWAQLQSGRYPELKLLYHIPNEGFRSPATGARLRAEGLRRGVPDICLPAARGGYHGLYIELKRTKGGVASAEQLGWLVALREAGYAATICRGWDDARRRILEYLDLDGEDDGHGT